MPIVHFGAANAKRCSLIIQLRLVLIIVFAIRLEVLDLVLDLVSTDQFLVNLPICTRGLGVGVFRSLCILEQLLMLYSPRDAHRMTTR